jgi:RNA-directed DNA polymerase
VAVKSEMIEALVKFFTGAFFVVRPAGRTHYLRGWVNYFRLSSGKRGFEALDEWLRRKLRCILWRQWKNPRTRAGKLMERGIEKARAYTSAYNGRGPWWNAGASHMNLAIPVTWLTQQGLLSLLDEHRR